MKQHESDARALMSVHRMGHTILRVRGHNVILDADLAVLYGTTTKRLNEQVRRNAQRFPRSFMFRLTEQEFGILRSQIATSRWLVHGGRRYLPHVFTEHGAIMAANVVNSPSAIQSHADLARKLAALETKYDGQFTDVFRAIRELTSPRTTSRKRIGFRPPKS